jgi:hypothetical protein
VHGWWLPAERERQRRSTIRNLFDHLRRNVPAVEAQEGTSDRQILVEAAKHVEQLQHDSHSLEETLVQLRIENLKLRMGTSNGDREALHAQLLQLLGEAAEIARIKEEYNQPPPMSPVRKGRGQARHGLEQGLPSVGSAPAGLSRGPQSLGPSSHLEASQSDALSASPPEEAEDGSRFSFELSREASTSGNASAAGAARVPHGGRAGEKEHGNGAEDSTVPAAPSGGEDLLELLMVVERERQELGQGKAANPGQG